jgi:hypothetical protein
MRGLAITRVDGWRPGFLRGKTVERNASLRKPGSRPSLRFLTEEGIVNRQLPSRVSSGRISMGVCHMGLYPERSVYRAPFGPFRRPCGGPHLFRGGHYVCPLRLRAQFRARRALALDRPRCAVAGHGRRGPDTIGRDAFAAMKR